MALRFMTRYPMAAHEEFAPGDFGRCTAYFPLVGFFAGLDLMLLRWTTLLDKNGLHYWIWAFLLLLFWVWGSDSLHLDGLADTSDALASRRQGGAFLEVMQDSHVGAFGAIAVSLALIAKFAWLCSLPMQGWWFMPLPLVFSRLHSSLACQVRPYAGNPGSLGSLFVNESRHPDLNAAVVWSLAAFFLLLGPSIYFGFATVEDAAKALGVCVAGVALGRTFLRLPMGRLGGISGDLIGWSQVVTETLIAFGLTLVLVH